MATFDHKRAHMAANLVSDPPVSRAMIVDDRMIVRAARRSGEVLQGVHYIEMKQQVNYLHKNPCVFKTKRLTCNYPLNI